MKQKICRVLFSVIIAAAILSCGKDDDNDGSPCSLSWATEVSDEINAYYLASQAFTTDPTPANCQAYKQAGQAYLNALRPFGDCTLLSGQDRLAWENAIAEAQENLDDSEC